MSTGSSKHYSGYGLTSLGSQQNFQVGSDYRKTYISESSSNKQILGISSEKVVNSQIFASAPDQTVLLNTATAFLQGLYPPLEDSKIASQTLNNGSKTANPLNGYQYVVLHSEDSEAPDTIWLKGDESCPAAKESISNFEKSSEFKAMDLATTKFYGKFWEEIKDVYDYQPSDLQYKNAYDIFDLLNVASIHNTSSAGDVTEEELYRLRVLADSAEFAANFDESDPARSMGGRTFAGAVLDQMNQMVSSQGNLKFSLLAGSYDTFLSFFGLAKLTSVSDDFFGLPTYASTMSFELFTEDDVDAFPENDEDLRVRFLFRNGTEDALTAFPLFGAKKEDMSFNDFVKQMKDIAITSPEEWCNTCQSDALFCAAYKNASSANVASSGNSGMSNVVAGVIGAVVTLGVFTVLGAVAFFAMRRRRAAQVPPMVVAEKSSRRSSFSSA